MAAKKKTAKAATTAATSAATSDVATATKKAPVKAAAKKKATAKKSSAKKKATAKKVTELTDDTAPKAAPPKAAAKKKAAAKAAPKKKVAAKKTVAKKATAKKKATTVRIGSNGEFKTFEPYKLVKGEEYMNEEQIEHFRTILLNWKTSLMEEVDRTVGHMKNDATNFPDPNDRATQEEEFSLELRTRDRERKLIKKIDESITKLDEDEYGYCDGCGVEIGIRRLEARPTANMCIECKTLEEIREKQIA